MNLHINTNQLPSELKTGLSQLVESAEYSVFIEKNETSIAISFEQTEKHGFAVIGSEENISILYNTASDAFRALGYLLGCSEGIDYSHINHTEKSNITLRAVQLEASRNGVMTVDAVKAFIRRLALMGINGVALYTEDTFQVDGEPFWGYLRGAYTQDEFRELDDYANNMGVEMFPCIQALGHLKQVLQWGNAYGEITDTDHILLVGEEKTYELIEKIIKSISSCFRSNRIHIGMDEAHGLGTGQYKKINGERATFDIINEHLKEVSSICKKMKLNPMIWSDMYFRLGSETNNYYDENANIPQNVIDNIDSDIDLVYWDYYHTDKEFYDNFIDKHRKMNKEPIVAPGAWTWGRFWCALPFSYDTILPCMQSCYDKKITQTFLTTWGDDGMEVDIFSALPAIQFYAELCYNREIDRKQFANNLAGSCNIDLDAYERASDLDICVEQTDGLSGNANPSKWLLWDDPFIGLCEAHQWGMSFKKHYSDLAISLEQYAKEDDHFKFPAQLAKVLSIKCDLRKHLIEAYSKKDLVEIKKILINELKPLVKETEILSKTHRDLWLSIYKPFGLEVIEIRYGGLINRLKSLVDRLEDLISGEISSIPEFETKQLTFARGPEKSIVNINSYQRMATPSVIF